MSKPLTRTYSLRRHIRPIIDVDEDDDDDQRRNSSGRKRVEVVECLLDTSSDEIDNNDNISVEKPSNILWLTFSEICHIRAVLAQESLSLDKQYSQLRNGRICFRCRKDIFELFFLPSFLRFNNHELCFVCQQIICTKCANVNFIPPALKILMPMRIQNLIKTSSSLAIIKNQNEKNNNKSNTKTRTICYDCLQIFNENINTPQRPVQTPTSPFRRTYSLPPMSSKSSTETRHTRHRRRPQQVTNYKIENNNHHTETPR